MAAALKSLLVHPQRNGFLSDTDLAKASNFTFGRIDEQMVADIHIGGGGAVEAARTLFASHANFRMGAVNAETNAGTHLFSRAMSEAADVRLSLPDHYSSARLQ